jgi:hypothetical protein
MTGRGALFLFLLVLLLVISVLGCQFLLLEFLLLLLLLVLGILGGLDVLEVLHAERFDLVVAELLDQLLLLRRLHLDHDVFGLEVRVDDLASLVQVDQSQQHIPGNLLDQPQRHAFVLVLIVLDDV